MVAAKKEPPPSRRRGVEEEDALCCRRKNPKGLGGSSLSFKPGEALRLLVFVSSMHKAYPQRVSAERFWFL